MENNDLALKLINALKLNYRSLNDFNLLIVRQIPLV